VIVLGRRTGSRFISLLARRQGIHAGDGFENLDDLIVARQGRNEFLLFLRQ
jgi:hypothetical protein